MKPICRAKLGLTTEYRATFEGLFLSTGSSARHSIPRSLSSGSSARHSIPRSLSSGSSARQSTGPLLNANLSRVARRLVSWVQGLSQVARRLVGRFQGILFRWLVGSSVDSRAYFQIARRLASRLLRLIPPSEVSGRPKVIIIMQNWYAGLETPIPSVIFIGLPLKFMRFLMFRKFTAVPLKEHNTLYNSPLNCACTALTWSLIKHGWSETLKIVCVITFRL